MALIECDPATCLEPLAQLQIEQVQRSISQRYGQAIVLPADFVAQSLAFHGGIPTRSCFAIDRRHGWLRRRRREIRVVCRFLNFLTQKSLSTPFQATWRQWADHDIRLDYSIDSILDYESWCGRLHEARSAELVPIAAIDFAGHNARVMDHYDLLCFDYAVSPPPLTIWEFEEFYRYDRKRNFVAANFTDFAKLLYDDPSNPIVEERCEHF